MIIDIAAVVGAVVAAFVGLVAKRAVNKRNARPQAPLWLGQASKVLRKEDTARLLQLFEEQKAALAKVEGPSKSVCPKCKTEQSIPEDDYICAGCRALI